MCGHDRLKARAIDAVPLRLRGQLEPSYEARDGDGGVAHDGGNRRLLGMKEHAPLEGHELPTADIELVREDVSTVMLRARGMHVCDVHELCD